MTDTQREPVHFEPKDAALRDDVRELGAIVGEVIAEQCGEAVFAAVEQIRQAAITQRETGQRGDLGGLLDSLDTAAASDVIRGFSTYFQVVNIAEKVHRIRRRREWLRDTRQLRSDSLEAAMRLLAEHRPDPRAAMAFLDGLLIEPVFTAHPTEPTRRTILLKQQQVARRLVERMNPALTPQEHAVLLANIRAQVTAGWQTEEHPSTGITVGDEREQVLFFLAESLYRVIPAVYEHLEQAIAEVWGEASARPEPGIIFRFGSWVGGDMDGNPNVGPDTIRETLALHRRTALELYRAELRQVARELSQAPSRIGFAPELLERIETCQALFPEALEDVAPRHRDMPYRVWCALLRRRLAATARGAANGYANAEVFLVDLALMSRSLAQNKGEHAGLYAVKRLQRRAETFRFHLATLDLRQDSEVHRQCIAHCLRDEAWMQRPRAERTARLQQLLDEGALCPLVDDAAAEKTLEVFRAAGECLATYGERAIGPYIISMAQGADDVLSVLLLARWAGLADENGVVPLDIAPLLETVDDLERGPEIFAELLDDRVYQAHLETRRRRQMVMIGYSDSNKGSGIAAARWALHQAEERLVAVAESRNLDLTLFHGRGGTISRGGGRTHTAALAAPRGAVRGRLRVTEQGEIINAKYGLRGIAIRTLEQAASSVAEATLRDGGDAPPPLWRQVMEDISAESRSAYRALVHEDDGFYAYFRQATPIDVIERMRIGSRPPARRQMQGIRDLRAIPWVFAWTQTRAILPGWYGVGHGLEAAVARHGEAPLKEMFERWMFMRAMLDDLEMVLAKCDLGIARRYAELAESPARPYAELIEAEYRRTVDLVLRLKGTDELLANDATLNRTIRLRNPYVDPMSLLQVDLLRRWREGGREDEALFRALLLSVNGIAHGLQNTG
ncbi:phosphoenolpyruvate carboxylase [Thioalkalivibrio sp. XN279]|uniref:phosphoenolpyruvate carboxylase n=1 Tax=Thioalkalivibrio sp. XN279 TaxID=2714953 RepID=UPI00140CF5B8|nr:phosphoenolpyruvate carboxylase [Thioalkalivibrio sp. XN279]NHA13738.1 phosphoenolpyruvate carboxylase [Thioalkalivibrio sp. XN279]